MAFALETIIVPVLLLTIVAITLISAEAGLGAIVAGIVGLSLLWLIFVNVLRFARREESEPGDDQAPMDRRPSVARGVKPSARRSHRKLRPRRRS